MSEDLYHECGVAALYWLNENDASTGPSCSLDRDVDVVGLLPGMLLDLQNRGQLAAGMSTYSTARSQILDTFKDVGSVSEVFRMSHPAKHESIIKEYAGSAAIGHTRYATCGKDDARYAQPFERHHGRLWKWFSFAFNGNLANYTELRDRLLAREHYYFTLDTDTEMLMHSLAYGLRGDNPVDLRQLMTTMCENFDGAYNIAFLDAMGRMFVSRDPLGLRPMSWGVKGNLFAAASESVALSNIGIDEIHRLNPGEMIIIEDGKMRIERYAAKRKHAHCFFEWVYFSNVASSIDNAGVYLGRFKSGEKLAEMEDQEIDGNSIVVPVPDTAKAAADAFAYCKRIPCVEGLMRNRYVGRTFIQPDAMRGASVKSKYTPLPSVLEGKKVFLIEDSIVRSTTLRILADQIRRRGKAKEVHVRVACPPIVAPCFYGIDMSTLGELFAPAFTDDAYNGTLTDETLAKMAAELQVDSLKYLPVPDVGPCLSMDQESLCLGCVTGKYPTDTGNRLMASAKCNCKAAKSGRAYE